MIPLKGDTANYFLQTLPKKGRFGSNWRGVRDGDKLPVIIKSINQFTRQHIDVLAQLNQMSHPVLAETIDFFISDNQLFVVRPFYSGTDLKTIINTADVRKKLTDNQYIDMAAGILAGLEVLHSQNILHRDIKPSNIVIVHDDDAEPQNWDLGNVKLIDFEQGTFYPDNSGLRAPFSLIYSPPEFVLKYNYLVNATSDLFALAITLYHAVAGKPPFTDCNAEVLLNLQLTYPIKASSKMNDSLFAVIQKASYKEPFPLPPRKMSPQNIEETLIKGIQGRYQSANEMLFELRGVEFSSTVPMPWYKRLF